MGSTPMPSNSWNPPFERRLAEELAKVRQEITALDERRPQEIGALDGKCAERYDFLARWMFIFWVGRDTVIAGTLFAAATRALLSAFGVKQWQLNRFTKPL